jgi:Fur family iron response transcriptional regulator
MFGKGDRHLTAELHRLEASEAGVAMSPATVYNTLHHFRTAGLIRQLSVGGSKAFFDTSTAPHYHFFVEGKEAWPQCRPSTVSSSAGWCRCRRRRLRS